MLHTPTIFVLVFLVSAILAVALAFVAQPKHPELRWIAAATGLNALTYVFFLLRDLQFDAITIPAANATLSISYALFAEGIYRFLQRPAPRARLWLPVPLAILVALLTLNDPATRVVALSLINMAQLAMIVIPLWQSRQTLLGRGAWLLGAGVVAVVAVYGARALLAMLDPLQLVFITASSPSQAVPFVVGLAGVLLIALGTLVMIKERAEWVHQEAAHRLAVSERHYRQLIEAANEGICVLQDGRVRYANPHVATLTGYSAGQILNKPFLDFIHEDDRAEATHNHMRRLLGEAENERFTLRVRCADGQMRHVEVSGVQYEWQGRPATLNFLTDVSARHAPEPARTPSFSS